MVCVKEDQAKEGAHAFTEESYHIESRGSSMGIAVAPASTTLEGSRSIMHRRSGMEPAYACCGPQHFGVRGLPGFGPRAIAAGGVRCLGGRTASDSARPGEASEHCLGRGHVAAPLASWPAGSGRRLAREALLWEAETQPQRNLSRQASAGHHEVPRLRHGLYRRVWAALYAGNHLGETSRIEGCGVAALADAHPRNGPENQVFAAGSRFLQCSGHGIPASGATPLSDAGHVSWTQAQEETPQERSALDQTAESGLVHAHFEERQANGDDLGVRCLSYPPQPERREARAAKTPFRCLAGARFSDRDSRTLPQALWHRIELPPGPTGADIHLHAGPPLAVGVCGSCNAAAKPVGLDPCDELGRRSRRHDDPAARADAFQTPARMDCSSCGVRTA